MASVLDLVKYYQHSIEKYTNDEQKILNSIDKLFNLDVTVQHLQETGVGRTVNALRKEPGNVGQAARALVYKWKLMVAAEESDQEGDHDTSNYNGNGKDSDDSGNQSKSKYEQTTPLSSSQRSHEYTNGNYSGSKRNYHSSEEEEPDRKKSKHSSGSSSHKRSYSDEKSDESENDSQSHDTENSETEDSESDMSDSSEDDTTANRKIKIEPTEKEKSSRHSSHDNHTDNKKDTSRSKKAHTSSRHSSHNSETKHSLEKSSSKEKYHSSSEKSSLKEKSHSSHEKSRDRDKSSDKKHKSDHGSSEKEKSRKEELSSSSRHHSSSLKHKSNSQNSSSQKPDSGSEKNRSQYEKHKSEKPDSGSDKHKSQSEKYKSDASKSDKEKHKGSSEKEIPTEKHKSKSSSSSSSKEKHSTSKEKSKDSSSKDKLNDSHKSEKKHLSSSDGKSKSSDSKSKSEKNEDKSTEKKNKHKSESSSHRSSKSSKTTSKEEKPKKKLVNNEADSDDGIDCGSGASFAEALGMVSPAKPKKKLAVSKNTPSPNNTFNDLSPAALLSPSAKLAPLPAIEISALPEISPNYKPRPPPKLMSHFNEGEAITVGISTKNQRTKVYSGNKSGEKEVGTLFDICIRVLQEHIDALEYTGGVPYEILKPVVDKATPEQLFTLEHFNPYLMEDTDHLWQSFCNKSFYNKKRQDMETWREMYIRCQEEQECRLKSLTKNIKIAQEAKRAPIKQTKMAYVDSIVKPPRNIARKQALHGTAHSATASPAARVAALAAAPNVLKGGSVRPPPSAPVSSSHFNKPKKAPLMQKALQFMRGRKR